MTRFGDGLQHSGRCCCDAGWPPQGTSMHGYLPGHRRANSQRELMAERREKARELAKTILKNGRWTEKRKYLWDGGALAVGAGIAIMVTDLWPSLYWYGVVLFYVGTASLARHIATDDAIFANHPSVRKCAALIGLLAIFYLWSAKVVFVRASIGEEAVANIGDYPQGQNVSGIQWEDHFEDLRLHLTNNSDYDFRDMDISLTSDLWVMGGIEEDNVCSHIRLFQENSNKVKIGDAWLGGTDSSGKPMTIPLGKPIDVTAPTGLRVICDTFPRHSTISLVIVLIAFNPGRNGVLEPSLFASKRLPNWISLEGDYRALGRTRDVSYRISPVPH